MFIKLSRKNLRSAGWKLTWLGFSVSVRSQVNTQVLWNLDVLYDDGVVLVVVMMMVNILELYLHNSSSLLISTPLILETTLGDKMYNYLCFALEKLLFTQCHTLDHLSLVFLCLEHQSLFWRIILSSLKLTNLYGRLIHYL